MSVKYVTDKANITRSTVIDAEKMTADVRLATRHSTGTVQCHWTLDFSGCSQAQLIELAKRSIVITEQNRFRNAGKDELEALQERNIDVAEALVRESATALPPAERAAKLVGKMTAEEKAKLLALLQG